MKRDGTYYRNLFLAGAFYNWMAGASFLLFHRPVFELLGIEPVLYPAILQAFAIVIVVLGIGYFWVSLNIHENHPIVVMGILAKSTAFFLFAYHWLYGNIPFSLLVFLIVDLGFAILFLDFLVRCRTLTVER